MNDPSVFTKESTKESSVWKNFEPIFSSVYADAVQQRHITGQGWIRKGYFWQSA
jgi:hypothetical protein